MRTGVIGTALAVALAVSGCTAERANDYAAETVATLQGQVLDITTAAATGDPALALVQLNELAAIANDALVRGQITEARRDSILSAILLVKTDLERAIEAQLLAEKAEEVDVETVDDPVGETSGPGEDAGSGADTTNPDINAENVSSKGSAGPGSSGSGSSGSGNGDDGTDEDDGDSRDDDSSGNSGPSDRSRHGDSNPGKGNKGGRG